MLDEFPLLSPEAIREWIERQIPLGDFRGRRVLLIVPDATRTAPLPLLFDALWNRLRPVAAEFDVLVALGTHPPMSERQMCRLLGSARRSARKCSPRWGCSTTSGITPSG